MGAFIIAGSIFLATLVLSALILFADGMSDSPTNQMSAWPTFCGGMALAAVVLASHWLPHIGW